MLQNIKNFFAKAWDWIKAMWDKHDDALEHMVVSVLPMVIDLAFRPDLDGEAKRKAIVDAIMDNAEIAAADVSHSLLNEAVEVAANRYKIQLGTTTKENIDATLDAALKAGRDYANNTLKIGGTEAEDAGVTPVATE